MKLTKVTTTAVGSPKLDEQLVFFIDRECSTEFETPAEKGTQSVCETTAK